MCFLNVFKYCSWKVDAIFTGRQSHTPRTSEDALGSNCLFLDWLRHLLILPWLQNFNSLKHHFIPVSGQAHQASQQQKSTRIFPISICILYYSLSSNALAILTLPSRHARLVIKFGSGGRMLTKLPKLCGNILYIKGLYSQGRNQLQLQTLNDFVLTYISKYTRAIIANLSVFRSCIDCGINPVQVQNRGYQLVSCREQA